MALLCPEDRQENPLITLLIGMPTAAMVEQPLSVWLAALEESLHTNTVILDNLTIEMESTEIKEAYRWITNQTKARSTQIKQ